jgi:signal recognition particle receptor subunit beta
MVQINFAHKEIQCKIVYYGPGMSGKTTNLEVVHAKAPSEARGELTSIATTGERTLYFDYMPLDLGSIAGIKTKFQLYTVPGQIYYKSTRRLVLQGVDGIVFVADSSAAKLQENKESMRDLEDNLREMGRSLTDVPIVIQYNKRDLPDAMPLDQLQKEVNSHGFPHFEAVATTGEGIFPTLKALASSVLEAVNRGGIGSTRPAARPAAPGASAPPPPRPLPPVAPPRTNAPLPPRPASPTPRVDVPRPAYAGSGPNGASRVAASATPETEAASAATATAVAPAPTRPMGAPSLAPSLSPIGAPSGRTLEDRMVQMSGLRRGPVGPRALLVVGLCALIAGAVWFVLTQVL